MVKKQIERLGELWEILNAPIFTFKNSKRSNAIFGKILQIHTLQLHIILINI